ncbi:glycosyltransferase family 2 protein [Kribbella jejuensis]|uniref:Glycosyltransferase involved in cell wall biosynthesis n=1 Tax=Kribbella jejuensis TaxID=236068 RepID=A0A542ELM8_9ACTN|nr:glycosyltransferase [Kribbella jejuensis]TQJ16248.1 glycosyltransferase involved in cell wall biosynthesis [Kribbella jejuensis]
MESVAVIVPCYNEAAAVRKVVTELRDSLPTARIYVYDNNSTDGTAAIAAAAGATVRHVARQGKGNVVRRAFADVEADVYLLIDGDDTYDASQAPELVRVLLAGPYDHVVGVRRHSNVAAYRPGHTLGNRMLTSAAGALFGREITDMLSGYRAFSRRYVKSFPALAQEFEIETELTIHTLHLRIPVAEVEVRYKERPAGGESKLRTYRDGLRILRWILQLARLERPTLFHGVLAAIFGAAALVLGVPVVLEFLRTGLVPRFPTAILASSIGLVAILMLVLGYLLDAVGRSRQEAARLSYLKHPAPVREPVLSGTDECGPTT